MWRDFDFAYHTDRPKRVNACHIAGPANEAGRNQGDDSTPGELETDKLQGPFEESLNSVTRVENSRVESC